MPKATPKPLKPQPVESDLPSVEYIPASQFKRAADNRQISPDQVAKMSDSIRKVGLLQPITARPVKNPETGGKDLEIVMGECRWLGCLDIGEEFPVPCFIREMSDKDAACMRAIENFQRKNLDEIEEAKAIKNLIDIGLEVDEIAHILGRDPTGVYRRLMLLKLPELAHTAIRKGNLSLLTAMKIAAISEDQMEDALQAVVCPTHSAKSLPERQALELLDREFIEPAKLAKEWEKRRDAIMENHPGAQWNHREEARKIDNYASGYVRSDRQPEARYLSDAARFGELIVPTWAELALKHGATLVIGCNYQEEANTYVLPQPIIDAEKAACSSNPADCIFIHEAAIHQAREAAEKRRREEEAHELALEEELKKAAGRILAADGISRAVTQKLAELSLIAVIFGKNGALAQCAHLFEIDQTQENWSDKTEAAVLKYLRSKKLSPDASAFRIKLASWVRSSCEGNTSRVLFEAGVVKAAEFPALHREYLEATAREARRERDGSSGTEPTGEEAA